MPGLDRVFHSLADATRRDILRRLANAEQTVSELAEPYDMSLAAIAKHISVLERAGLVTKVRSGKERVVRAVPDTIHLARAHLREYARQSARQPDAPGSLLGEAS